MAETNGNHSTKFSLINAEPFSGIPGEIRFENHLAQVDLDGDSRADLQIRLNSVSSFTERMLDCLQ